MKLHDYMQHAIQIYKRHLNIWYKCVGGWGGSYLMTLVGEIYDISVLGVEEGLI